MKKSEKKQEIKASLLEDMLSFITYTANRESDILAFMGLYQKAEPECRPNILDNLRACMDGNDYPNPYAESYHYTAADVSACGDILDEYLKNLATAEGNPDAISECVRKTVGQLNALNEKCEQYLIDTWRRERLCSFINTAAEQAGLAPKTDHTFQHRMW